MKILHLITSTNIGGAQIMLERYLAALSKTPDIGNHRVLSLLPDGVIAPRIRRFGVPLDTLGLSRSSFSPMALFRLRKALRDARVDVVHGWMYHGCLAASVGTIGGVDRPAVVWGIHHSLQDVRSEKPATRVILRALSGLSRRCAAITYCSDNSRVQHEAAGFASDRACLIPNAIDMASHRADPSARSRLEKLVGPLGARLVIGNVARNHPMKDHVTMVRATAALLKRGHDVHAVLIGEGLSTGPAAQEVARLGLAERVSILEARSDIHALVPGFDVFLLSSAWGEAFPLAVTEAMAAEVPCVVTDVGDCRSLVGESGVVVPPGNPEAQADGVETLIRAGRGGRAALGRAARARVAEICSMDSYIARHEAIYRAAAANIAGNAAHPGAASA